MSKRRPDPVDERILLDPALDGEVGGAVVLLRTATDVDAAGVEAAMAAIPEVVQVLDVTGPVDYHVRVRHASPQQLYEVVNRLRALPGVTGIETQAVLREVLDRRR